MNETSRFFVRLYFPEQEKVIEAANAKKPQTASDFFPNTETALTWGPEYESCRQQDLEADIMNPDAL